jgi:hypothetical protein
MCQPKPQLKLADELFARLDTATSSSKIPTQPREFGGIAQSRLTDERWSICGHNARVHRRAALTMAWTTGVLETTKSKLDESPPGAGLLTTTGNVPGVVIMLAGRSASIVVALMNAVFSGVAWPVTFTVVPLKNPVPRTVKVSGPVSTKAAEGHRLVIVGVAAFAVSVTATFCVLFAVGTPDAVTTSLPL